MSTTFPCATCGSQSATGDYCDVCGAAIFGPTVASAADAIEPPDLVDPPDMADLSAVQPARPSTPDARCYFCGAPRDPGDAVCDVCGLDFASGRMPGAPDPTPVPGVPGAADPTPVPVAAGAPDPTPVPVAPVVPDASDASARSGASATSVLPSEGAADTMIASAGRRWTALVGADRAFFDGNVTAGVVAFPDAHFPREVVLTGDEVTIGRRSESKGYNPDIDLSSPDDDPAVSRRHAVLRRQPDQSWVLVDVGSTNGTWLNDDDEPLPQGEPRPLRDGDRVLLGAFTCITIRSNEPPATS